MRNSFRAASICLRSLAARFRQMRLWYGLPTCGLFRKPVISFSSSSSFIAEFVIDGTNELDQLSLGEFF